MTIQRMDHVAVVVDDLEAAVSFYRLCYLRGPDGIIVVLAEQLR